MAGQSSAMIGGSWTDVSVLGSQVFGQALMDSCGRGGKPISVFSLTGAGGGVWTPPFLADIICEQPLSPVGIGICGKMLYKYFLKKKNFPENPIFIFSGLKFYLVFGSPKNEKKIVVPDNQISLHFGVPGN